MASVITYAEAVTALKQWTEALQATSGGQSYSLGGRSLTRQDNATIRAEIQRWHNTVTTMDAARAGKRRALGSQSVFPVPGRGAGDGIISDDLWLDGRT